MTFAYSDTWLLEAIKFSENMESATLTDIRQAKFRFSKLNFHTIHQSLKLCTRDLVNTATQYFYSCQWAYKLVYFFSWESNNRIIHAAMSPQDLPAQF
jgi:hypothetical protein